MIAVISEAKRIKPSFQLVTGTEYMISAKAIGATGLLSPLANVAPKLVRELYDVCMQEQFQSAYDLQVDAAFLYRLFNEYGISGFKVISLHLGRDVGTPRVPLDQLNAEQIAALLKEWQSCERVQTEVHAWGV
jgi:dihydrodipicolinate synthase/N-acetylneuraminate lyase